MLVLNYDVAGYISDGEECRFEVVSCDMCGALLRERDKDKHTIAHTLSL